MTNIPKLPENKCSSPDVFFTQQQQERLGELMARWRAVRDSEGTLPAEDQAELEGLVDAETRAAGARAAALLHDLAP